MIRRASMVATTFSSLDMTSQTPVDRASYLARARRVIPGGASAGGRRVFEEVIVRTAGAYLWNGDGKRFIDYLLSYGPIVVGHSDPRVNEAVLRTAATNDLHWVGPQAGEVELAELIVALLERGVAFTLVLAVGLGLGTLAIAARIPGATEDMPAKPRQIA
jgi:4-aminobutyrate aminotransferase-like enzyme